MGDKYKENYNKRFVNPYNFIPLVGKCERSDSTAGMDDSYSYTGYFDCRIRLLTPLFIPNTSSSSRLLREDEKSDAKCKKEDWKGYDFFSYDDWSAGEMQDSWPPPPPADPVIPGSEIRGAVRSVYEAAFNGCLSSVSVDRVLSRRTAEPKEPGILKMEHGTWTIRKCKRAMLYVTSEKIKKPNNRMGIPVLRDQYNQWKEGQEIWFKLNDEPFITRRGQNKIEIGKVIIGYEVIEGSSLTNPDKTKDGRRNGLKKKGYVKGWLHKGEAFSRKHHEAVFYDCDESDNNMITVKTADIICLEKTLNEYRNPGKNRMLENEQGWYPGYEVSEQGTLVYYKETSEGHVLLSPACIGKEVFAKTVGNLLELNGGYGPCSGKELCPACQIFGMVGKNGGSGTFAYESKVRVTDARLIHPTADSRRLFEDPVILPELGEPKPGAVEFYTESPYTSSEKMERGFGYWTYDYKHKIDGKPKKPCKIHLSEEQPKLRGRKYYWHSTVNLSSYSRAGKIKLSAMRQRIRPMKAGAPNSEPIFCFRVYFEQLSRQQLCQLKWTLDFGNPDCAHKMGRAKPLGFGSVQFVVDALYLRVIDAETGEWAMKSPDLTQFFVDSIAENEAMRTLKKMADWSERPVNVTYPSVEMGQGAKGNGANMAASHQWFAGNKGDSYNPNFLKVLPQAREDAMKDLGKGKALYTLVKHR